ncbi:hepatocyte nuclear factor 6-like isoform X2 [Ornithodoros turicata]|uniref:hepatocyte nuclear factor 6-like isoform X2 n=1 Tax=Ornithodoros turicata TaxID=34597 RepID=UPI0031398ED1
METLGGELGTAVDAEEEEPGSSSPHPPDEEEEEGREGENTPCPVHADDDDLVDAAPPAVDDDDDDGRSTPDLLPSAADLSLGGRTYREDDDASPPAQPPSPTSDDDLDDPVVSPGSPGMIDASDFRGLGGDPTGPYGAGRMSPAGFSASSSYATLTPLQPLPPISTMSDKFSHYGHHHHHHHHQQHHQQQQHHPGGGFPLMQSQSPLGAISMNSYHAQYDKLSSSGMSPPMLGGGGLPSPPSSYSQNGLSDKGLNGYDAYAPPRGLGSPQSPTSLHSPTGMLPPLNGLATGPPPTPPAAHLAAPASPPAPPQMDIKPPPPTTVVTVAQPRLVLPVSVTTMPQVALSVGQVMVGKANNVMPNLLVGGIGCSPNKILQQQTPQQHQQAVQQQVVQQQQQQQQAVQQQQTTQQQQQTTQQQHTGNADEVEEINTKELAQRISAELKRYSIPQAIFAQRVLCRSQGTLSDLLRNPKPWSKLKSGRETFRRMYKWLEEPEFQRMSALRLAVKMNAQSPKVDTTCPPRTANLYTPHSTCKRKEDPSAPTSQQPVSAPPPSSGPKNPNQPKKPRLVFTDLQRRTLQAIFKETKRPSKEMQITISQQLGLELSTVGNFFMNARRRSQDKWQDEADKKSSS